MKKRRPNLIELAEDIDDNLQHSENPREGALFVVGFAIGMALRHGWTFSQLETLRAWPFKRTRRRTKPER